MAVQELKQVETIDWEKRIDRLTVSFKPVVNSINGKIHGLESCVGSFSHMGFYSKEELYGAVSEAGYLKELHESLFEKTLQQFSVLSPSNNIKLFYPLGFGLGQSSWVDSVQAKVQEYQIKLPNICWITQKGEIIQPHSSVNQANICVSGELDHFSEFFAKEPNFQYFLLSRKFYTSAMVVRKNRFFMQKMVEICSYFGVSLLALDVETEGEALFLRDLGCNYIQGDFVSKPIAKNTLLPMEFAGVEKAYIASKRGESQRTINSLAEEIKFLEPISVTTPVSNVVAKFQAQENVSFFPVVNEIGEPIGLIRDRELKAYVFSPFGHQLLNNKGIGLGLDGFIIQCPKVNSQAKIEDILNIFANQYCEEGILIVENQKYKGMLNANSLVRLLNEKNLFQARDQNPLSKLPGNQVINGYIQEALDEKASETHYLVYFDFDKPFNDHYGFRKGDRAILLFAELMQKFIASNGDFIGHIGGDDFFAGLTGDNYEAVAKKVKKLCYQFAEDVKSFYEVADRNRGFIHALDRSGREQNFPLLGVSASLLQVSPQSSCRFEEVADIFAPMKKASKYSPEHFVAATFWNQPVG
ncbi:MAG: EAL domain-containing protein [SAR324 cluster bacterium]|nr:EAL domain-containing protein [SAR324 cluster bacterium]